MMGAAAVLILLAIGHVSTNQEALDARDTLAFCEFSSELSSTCSDAQIRWDDAIGYAWSLSALGIGLMAGAIVVIERPLPDGSWPRNEPEDDPLVAESSPKSHHAKRDGSWRRRGREEEE
jgi:hypothetical protein